MGNEVKRIKTEVSESQMAQAIISAWETMFKSIPTKEQVSLILAQNALETGHRKAMWNNNVGNIKASPKGKYDYFYLKGPEQTAPGKWEQFRMSFRAYPTLKDGVIDYLSLLSKSQRYANAWKHIKEPNPAAFSKALKEGGYYTANEDAYTKQVTNLYSKFNKGNSYEVARSGKSDSVKESNQGLLAQSPRQADSKNNKLWEVFSKFLEYVTASEKSNKKLYKRYLPANNIVIKVQSDYTNAIEFSRILCAAINEELLADAFTHGNDDAIEVQCTIHGPSNDCFNAVKELTQAVASAFKDATIKIGGIDVQTKFFINKKSSYQEINVKTAANQYRKFLLKFI